MLMGLSLEKSGSFKPDELQLLHNFDNRGLEKFAQTDNLEMNRYIFAVSLDFR